MLKSVKKIIWPITLISAVIAVPFLIFGIFQSFQVTQGAMEGEEVNREEIIDDSADESSEEREDASTDGYRLLTLGDSLARGTGDEENLGFAGRVAQTLDELLEVPIHHENYAVEGLVISEMLELLNNNEFLEELQDADIIMISIGGNDVRRIRGLPAEELSEAYMEIEEEYQADLEEIIRRLGEENPQALKVFLGLYNLDYSVENIMETELLLRWNALTYELIEIEENFVWIPTYDLFQYRLSDSLSQDQLHPNGLGYEHIAQRIVDVILPYFQ